MMELIPWMLVMVWFHPIDSDPIQIERVPMLYFDEAECRAAGARRIAEVDAQTAEHNGVKPAYSCFQVPEPQEYDRVFSQLGVDEARDAPASDNGK